MALGEIASLAEAREVVRALVRADDLRAAGLGRLAGGSRALRGARRHCRHWRCGRERHASVLARHPGAGGPVGRATRRRARRRSTALVYRSNLLGSDRALANQRRRQHVRRRGRQSTMPGREQRVLWVKGSGTDLATITRGRLRRASARRAAAVARARVDGRRGDGRLPAALRRSRPTSRGRRSRRCCTRSCRRRTSTTRTRTRSSR